MSDAAPPSVGDPAADPAVGTIEPDTKDWTWVLDHPCPECGFVAAEVDPASIGAIVRSLTPRWQAALARPEARERPRPGVWSVVEYGAHVRDVNKIFAERLRAMLALDYPMFASWDQDSAAVEQRYDRQDAVVVSVELGEAARLLADRLDAVRPEQLGRPGRRSNGSVFTVRTLSQYYLHDVVHHLHDVRG